MKTPNYISGLAIPALSLMLAASLPGLALGQSILSFSDNMVQKYADQKDAATYQVPIGPFENGAVPSERAEGQVIRQVWRSIGQVTPTLQMMLPLRNQLKDAGYDILFECQDSACGGFDFRYETDVISEPVMHVDLGDFQYLSAKKPDGDGYEYVSLLISRSADQGYIQIATIGTLTLDAREFATSTKSTPGDELGADSLTDRLVEKGSAVLEGLEFANGKSQLNSHNDESLQDLALFLEENPEQVVILVGHTDSSGSLAGNVALSKKRAAAVMQRLVDTYGIDPKRLAAEGVGYLAPRASNTTEDGRNKNRRVEVVLTAK